MAMGMFSRRDGHTRLRALSAPHDITHTFTVVYELDATRTPNLSFHDFRPPISSWSRAVPFVVGHEPISALCRVLS
ncbi:hypothetical protein PM082_022955 [Marasmius tenuissimus]|nr:hypothetical protein PM082_022955 [Marasmius tenuissimus]